jgi:hypothetical protein
MGFEHYNDDRKRCNVGFKSFGLDKELVTFGKFSRCHCAAPGLRKYRHSVDKDWTLDFISFDK